MLETSHQKNLPPGLVVFVCCFGVSESLSLQEFAKCMIQNRKLAAFSSSNSSILNHNANFCELRDSRNSCKCKQKPQVRVAGSFDAKFPLDVIGVACERGRAAGRCELGLGEMRVRVGGRCKLGLRCEMRVGRLL